MTARHFITPARDRLRQNKRVLLWAVTALPLLLLMASHSSSDDVLFLTVLGGLSFGLFSISPARRSGYRGEEATLDQLVRALPTGYSIFNQIEVPNARSRTGTTEVDAVVIGPAGVFNIEVKNNRGEVFGEDEYAPNWRVRKIGRGGKPYTSSMRNPIRQALSQAMALRRYLESRDIRVWVQPIVVKVYPRSVWHVGQQRGVPVVALSDGALQRRIVTDKPGRLASGEIAAVQAALYALKSVQ